MNPILLFSKAISGKYSNKYQSINDPKNFPHISVYFRPISWDILNGPGLYSEQSFEHDPWTPYRQAIHRIYIKDNIIILNNYQLINKIRVAGAGSKPELLSEICKDKIELNNGCSMYFKESNPGNYIGNIEPGKRCLVYKNKKNSYLISQVKFNNDDWICKDIGCDLETNKQVWGTENGPFLCKKVFSLSNEINKKWLLGK